MAKLLRREQKKRQSCCQRQIRPPKPKNRKQKRPSGKPTQSQNLTQTPVSTSQYSLNHHPNSSFISKPPPVFQILPSILPPLILLSHREPSLLKSHFPRAHIAASWLAEDRVDNVLRVLPRESSYCLIFILLNDIFRHGALRWLFAVGAVSRVNSIAGAGVEAVAAADAVDEWHCGLFGFSLDFC